MPSSEIRLSFTWLPRWDMARKPNDSRIPITSVPESRLSLGTSQLQFKGQQYPRVWRKAKIGRVFTFQM